MPAAASAEALCSCLRQILASLEHGDAVAAARWVPEMNALVGALPSNISEEQATEATHLLDRCQDLERGLRAHVLEALRQLGAARKSAAYRRILVRP